MPEILPRTRGPAAGAVECRRPDQRSRGKRAAANGCNDLTGPRVEDLEPEPSEIRGVAGDQDEAVLDRNGGDLKVDGRTRPARRRQVGHEHAPTSGSIFVEREDATPELRHQGVLEPLLESPPARRRLQPTHTRDQLAHGDGAQEQIARVTCLEPAQDGRCGPRSEAARVSSVLDGSCATWPNSCVTTCRKRYRKRSSLSNWGEAAVTRAASPDSRRPASRRTGAQ